MRSLVLAWLATELFQKHLHGAASDAELLGRLGAVAVILLDLAPALRGESIDARSLRAAIGARHKLPYRMSR